MCAEWTHFSPQITPDYTSSMYHWTIPGVYDHHIGGLEAQPITYLEDTTDAKVPLFKSELSHTSAFNFNRHVPLPRTNSFDSAISAQQALVGSVEQSLHSPTPSLFGDSSNPSSVSPIVPSQVPTNSILKSSTSSTESSPPKRLPRRRGRPRLRSPDDDIYDQSTPKPRRSRLPHNQVERKYRQGLNAELERLRKTIPTLPQRSPGDVNAPPKPSKATVLASAISYIQSVESERDKLLKEVDSLRKEALMGGSRARCYGCSDTR